MIYLKYDIANTVCVTLDSYTIPSGTTAYTTTFSIENLQDNSTTTFDVEDIAPSGQTRYNEFEVTIPSGQTSGYYSYDFYVKDVDTGEYVTSSLESGLCLVDLVPKDTYVYTGETNNIYVYKK